MLQPGKMLHLFGNSFPFSFHGTFFRRSFRRRSGLPLFAEYESLEIGDSAELFQDPATGTERAFLPMVRVGGIPNDASYPLVRDYSRSSHWHLPTGAGGRERGMLFQCFGASARSPGSSACTRLL